VCLVTRSVSSVMAREATTAKNVTFQMSTYQRMTSVHQTVQQGIVSPVDSVRVT
jgi:hypothetical protein